MIIGDGVMGTSTAYQRARKGAKHVVLIEKGPFFGVMSTGQCAGEICHQFSPEINIGLSIQSIHMLEACPQQMVHVDEAMVRMPILQRAVLLFHWAGLYGVMPDAYPILGRVPTMEGFYLSE